MATHTLESYISDKKTRFAVERCFEIIGEALARIGKLDANVLESIRGYRNIKSFRNLIVHPYDYIDDRIVWGIIQNDLDKLIEDVRDTK